MNCSLCQATVAFMPSVSLELQNVVLFMKCILPFTIPSGRSLPLPLCFSCCSPLGSAGCCLVLLVSSCLFAALLLTTQGAHYSGSKTRSNLETKLPDSDGVFVFSVVVHSVTVVDTASYLAVFSVVWSLCRY